MFICGELYYYLTWNRGIIASALETLVSFSNNESGQYNVGGLKLLIKHAAKFLSANSVLYNLPIFIYLSFAVGYLLNVSLMMKI